MLIEINYCDLGTYCIDVYIYICNYFLLFIGTYFSASQVTFLYNCSEWSTLEFKNLK